MQTTMRVPGQRSKDYRELRRIVEQSPDPSTALEQLVGWAKENL
jgi:hypothetical protein